MFLKFPLTYPGYTNLTAPLSIEVKGKTPRFCVFGRYPLKMFDDDGFVPKKVSVMKNRVIPNFLVKSMNIPIFLLNKNANCFFLKSLCLLTSIA